MTPQRAKELLPVIAAFAEGKPIQYKHLSESVWHGIENPIWDDANIYRVTPEPPKPMEVWLHISDTGILTGTFRCSPPLKAPASGRWVKFVEVVE